MTDIRSTHGQPIATPHPVHGSTTQVVHGSILSIWGSAAAIVVNTLAQWSGGFPIGAGKGSLSQWSGGFPIRSMNNG